MSRAVELIAGGEAAPAAPAPSPAVSVLLVDDDVDHALIVRRTLERRGQPFRVTHALDGEACLEALARETYAVVLLDYGLPRLNGLEVLERIRQLGLDVPVVMATGQGDERIAVEAMNAGAIDYVVKTSGYFTALPTVVNKVLRQHELALDNARLYAEARRQQDLLAQVFDSTSDGVVLVDGAGTIVYANRRAGELLDLDPGTAVGRPLADLIPGADAFRRLGEAPGRTRDGELPVDAGRRILRWVAQPTPAAGGFTITFQDLTREREMSQLKSEFVSFAAHQLRTPLSGIKWMLELAAEEPDAPPALLSYVREAAASAAGLLQMVNDLLDLTRLERGGVTGEVADCDLGALTGRVLDELAPLVREKGHDVAVTAPDGLPPVAADPRFLGEVIRNLVSNAIKYTPEAGRIRIRLDRADGEIQWAVEDNGIGVPKEAQARLFEKFYRASNAAAVDVGGKGLGLYLVRLVIGRLGGRLWWTSEEGRGTTFAFALPLGGST